MLAAPKPLREGRSTLLPRRSLWRSLGQGAKSLEHTPTLGVFQTEKFKSVGLTRLWLACRVQYQHIGQLVQGIVLIRDLIEI